jgi:hypothetical protein
VTITKDDLRNSSTKRMRLKSIARAIEFFATCYDALPGFDVNADQKEHYLNALLHEVEDMQKELTHG